MNTGRFASKTALVTGASGGIGGAISEALFNEGADIHTIGRTPPDGTDWNWLPVDLADEAALRRAAEQVVEATEGIDILVHAAGQYAAGSVTEMPMAELDRLWQVNARAPWLLTRKLLPSLKARQGSIVFVNSSIWTNARRMLGGYAASKYALKAMADALRDEVNEVGIQVLSVFPGRTASAMQKKVFAEEDRPYAPSRLLQPGDIAQYVLEALASQSTAEVTDLFIRPASKI